MAPPTRPDRPSLVELRGRVQKGHHRVIGNILARRFARPSAIYGTWLAVRLGLSAHLVTSLALLALLGGASAIGSGSRGGFTGGVALLWLGFWLDHVDGQVARWRGTASLDGVYLDYLMHHTANGALGFALGYGLLIRSGDPRWAIAGAAVAGGWGVLSLHNDCRYKAFWQRLKASEGAFRVEGGAGGKPSPPSRWPRRGLGLVTWPLFKACEGHVVLMALTVLAGWAWIDHGTWEVVWRGLVLGMAILAPSLALMRVTRAVRRGASEAEFARWFQPLSEHNRPR